MGQGISAKEENYHKRLEVLVGKMERVLSRDLIEIKKARRLISDYSTLVEEILSEGNLSRDARDEWSKVLPECYDLYYDQLVVEVAFKTYPRKSD